MLIKLDYNDLLNEHGDKKIPFYASMVSAGFPSPADDFIERRLNINDLVKRESSTYFFRVQGDSMLPTIRDGDIIVVDSSVAPRHDQIIVASIDGQFTVKRLVKAKGKVFLAPDNSDYETIEITEFMEFKVWGICTYTIHNLGK